jgi:predicted transcriptional regulator of viral defense system
MGKNNFAKLLNTESPFFTISSLQATFNITRESARTTASRLVSRGVLTRLCRDLFVLSGRKYSLFALANALYQPSVVSLDTALNYWGLIVQDPQVIFSVGLGSYRYSINHTGFTYRKINPLLFRFGQKKVADFFIAEPEKAFLDTLYMKSKGLADLLPEDINMDKLDNKRLEYYSLPYPAVVKKMMSNYQSYSYEAR